MITKCGVTFVSVNHQILFVGATIDIQTLSPVENDPMSHQNTMVQTAYSSLTAKPGILAGGYSGV